MKKIVQCVLCFVLMMSLTACASFSSQNITELLRAPALGGGQDEIQDALSEYLGEQPQYIFPKEGNWTSPLIRSDLDGNGRDEAILLYTLSDTSNLGREKGNAVWVAILDYRDDEWQVVQDIQGLSIDVANLEVADLLSNGTQQLIIGYTTSNLSAKTLGVYTYSQDVLSLIYQFDYSIYEVGDFTGRGGFELVVVSSEEQSMRMQFIMAEDGEFVTDAEMQAPVSLDANFVSCVNIMPGETASGEHIVVVDGVAAADTGALASQFVYYTGERFYTEEANPLRGSTSRISPLLTSMDIDGDDIVEIPLRHTRNTIMTPNADKNLEYVEWKDFTQAEPVTKQFGILDSDRAVYISLPESWKNNLNVIDGDAQGEWILQTRQTGESVLEMRYVEDGGFLPGAYRVPGSTSSYLYIPTGLTDEERSAISMTMMG